MAPELDTQRREGISDQDSGAEVGISMGFAGEKTSITGTTGVR